LSPARLARGALDGLYLVCGVLAGLALVAIAVIMLLLSVGRQVGFYLRGGDEMAAWLTAATAFLGLAYTFRHGDLIRVTLLIERLTGRPRRALETVVLLVASLFLGAFAWNALVMVWESWLYDEYAQGALAVPIWMPQAGMALGAAVLFAAVLDELARVLAGRRPHYWKDPPRTPEEVIERAAESGV
jgi:TRAP-type C4-dicarboxylate transport system permease small subunit